MVTVKEITMVLSELIGCYPNTKLIDPEATVRAWALVLGQYPADQVYKGARYHMSNKRFFPTPADIKEGMKYAGLYNEGETVTPKIETGSDKRIKEVIKALEEV